MVELRVAPNRVGMEDMRRLRRNMGRLTAVVAVVLVLALRQLRVMDTKV
jgi:hypothetical protein